MTILTLPSWDDFTRPLFRLGFNTVVHTSELSRAVQTVEFPGAYWQFEAGVRPMTRADYEAWLDVLAQLRGRSGRFYAGDPAARTPRGSAAATPGTPLVKGAAQTGSALAIDGAPNSATGYLLRGDRLAFDLPSGLRSLHRVTTASVDSDGSGNASIGIAPPLRESPADNAAIILTDPSCVMMLTDDDLAGAVHDEAGFQALTISAVEAFDTGA